MNGRPDPATFKAYLGEASFFSPHLLFKNAEDYFSGLPLNNLLVKDEMSQGVKARCQSAGQSFWLSKVR